MLSSLITELKIDTEVMRGVPVSMPLALWDESARERPPSFDQFDGRQFSLWQGDEVQWHLAGSCLDKVSGTGLSARMVAQMVADLSQVKGLHDAHYERLLVMARFCHLENRLRDCVFLAQTCLVGKSTAQLTLTVEGLLELAGPSSVGQWKEIVSPKKVDPALYEPVKERLLQIAKEVEEGALAVRELSRVEDPVVVLHRGRCVDILRKMRAYIQEMWNVPDDTRGIKFLWTLSGWNEVAGRCMSLLGKVGSVVDTNHSEKRSDLAGKFMRVASNPTSNIDLYFAMDSSGLPLHPHLYAEALGESREPLKLTLHWLDRLKPGERIYWKEISTRDSRCLQCQKQVQTECEWSENRWKEVQAVAARYLAMLRSVQEGLGKGESSIEKAIAVQLIQGLKEELELWKSAYYGKDGLKVLMTSEKVAQVEEDAKDDDDDEWAIVGKKTEERMVREFYGLEGMAKAHGNSPLMEATLGLVREVMDELEKALNEHGSFLLRAAPVNLS